MTIRLQTLTICGTLLTVLLISPTSTAAETPSPILRTLYNLTGGSDAGVVIGSGGVLYGTTALGGTGSSCSGGCGSVFQLSPPTSPGGSWTATVLHTFIGSPSDGAGPNGLVIGKGGVLYGTTYYGGAGSCSSPFGPPGCGTVFSLTPPASPGGAWIKKTLHNFRGSDGANPFASVVIGSGGVLYGTTAYGGTSNNGTVFSLTPPAPVGGPWTEAVLYNFTGTHGSLPEAAVAIGPNGVLYGTTVRGGSSNNGTVFALKP